jgi:hypothetical protein
MKRLIVLTLPVALLLGLPARGNQCEMIELAGGGRYVECDPVKAKAAKAENAEAVKKRGPAPKPATEESVEEFTARMAIVKARNEAERAEASAKLEVVRAEEERKQAAEKARAEAAFKSSGTQGTWRMTIDENKMDNRARLVLMLEGKEPLPNRLGPKAPALVIRCEAGKVDLYLNARTHLAGPSDDLGEHKFRVKFDEGAPEHLTGDKATSHDSQAHDRGHAVPVCTLDHYVLRRRSRPIPGGCAEVLQGLMDGTRGRGTPRMWQRWRGGAEPSPSRPVKPPSPQAERSP